MEWDSNNDNEWTTASLNTYLNGDYYNGLSSTAKEMISPTMTYLGGRNWGPSTHYGTAEDIYTWERGTDRYNTRQSLNDTKNISLIYPRDYTYTYAKGIDNTCYSDVYSCNSDRGGKPSKGWLYEKKRWWWTVSTSIRSFNSAWYFGSDGDLDSRVVTTYSHVLPVIYLITDIQFDGNHTGSSSGHYQLKI